MAEKFSIPDTVNAFDDVAGLIADPPAGRPMGEAIGRSGQDFCDAWSSVPPWAADTFTNSLPATRAGRKLADLVCKPYYDSNGYDPPNFLPPFEGGQCDAFYRAIGTISYKRRFCNSGTLISIEDEVFATEFSIRGPISGVSARVVEGGTCGARVWAVFCQTPAGERLIAQVLGVNGTFSTTQQSFTVNFERAGGVPDDCGDPPATILEPGDNPAPAPVQPPAGEEPGFDPDGQPFFYIPDFPGDGGDDLPVLPPDGDGGGDSGPIPPTEPTPGDESEGEGSGEGGGDNDFGDPPEGERWVGCEVRLTEVAPGTGIIPQSLPQTIYTAVQGNARLRFDSSAGSGYDTPIAIKSKSVWVWEPVRGANPAGVFVNVRPGISYTIRPYSVPVED